MSSFCDTFDLTSLIKEPTCYKYPDYPPCINLILTNKPLRFENLCVVETGLSDFHGNNERLAMKSLEMICCQEIFNSYLQPFTKYLRQALVFM